MAQGAMSVSLPEISYSASLLGRNRWDFISKRAQFLLGSCQRSLTKTWDRQDGLISAVQSFQKLTKILNTNLLQRFHGSSGNAQFFDGTFRGTFEFFLDLLLFNISLAGRKLLIE